ncbi:MAG: hypothetical protein ACK4N4_02720 [Burkholderiales bacterium]
MRKLQALLEMLGAAGVLGLGVLLFCAAFYLTAVEPVEQELRAQRTAAERLKSRSPYQKIAAGSNTDDLRRFQSLFPPLEQLTAEVERLYALARKAKLELQQGEYRLEDSGPGLASYRVTLPLRGAYPHVRGFVGAVLEEMPTASIDALRFERKKAGDAQLDAQIRLTVHFRSTVENELP